MPPTLLGISRDELDLAALVRLVTESGDQAPGRDGAVVTFLGTVRGENLGRRVVQLEYQAYEPLAVRAFEIIGAEVSDIWPEARLGLHHRIGTLRPGEVSVAIAAASPHRAEAFEACRYAIERVKQIAPIWKREIFEGGEAWIEGATADPSDSAARQAAVERACR
jgi:molybdopterin synthase catalytic subunit